MEPENKIPLADLLKTRPLATDDFSASPATDLEALARAMQGALLEQLSSAPTLSAALRADPLDSPVFRAALDAAVDKWWGHLGAQVARKVTWDAVARRLHIELTGSVDLLEPLLRADPDFASKIDVTVTLEKEPPE